MSTFKAFRIHEVDGKILGRFEDLTLEQLSPGEVVIEVHYSGINYKDALAATGAGKILRRYPLVGGIDLAGVVRDSGGFALRARRCGAGHRLRPVRNRRRWLHRGRARQGECVIPMPPGLDAFRAMALGTAGFTAALAIHRMERNGQTPARGPIVVTGATGGVGSIAIDMLAGRGYEVIAVTGKQRGLRLPRVVGCHDGAARASSWRWAAARWRRRAIAGAIDNVGGELLAGLTRHMDFWGNIASVGLAGGAELKTTVMPFILRGVSLLGINSSATPRAERLEVWQRIAGDLKPRHLERIASRTIAFAELPGRVPGLHRRKSHRPHGRKDRRAAVNCRPS